MSKFKEEFDHLRKTLTLRPSTVTVIGSSLRSEEVIRAVWEQGGEKCTASIPCNSPEYILDDSPFLEIIELVRAYEDRGWIYNSSLADMKKFVSWLEEMVCDGGDQVQRLEIAETAWAHNEVIKVSRQFDAMHKKLVSLRSFTAKYRP